MSRTVRIGITGSIGCGKSQVLRWLEERGVAVVDADQVARSATAPGEPAHDAVLRRFPAAIGPDGTLDRASLGRIVFEDAIALSDLEAIVHPAVRPRILAALAEAEAAGAPAVAIEAIKLVESGLGELCDEIWLVTCEPAVQRTRLLERGTPATDADRRVAAQGDITGRLAGAASRVLETSGRTEETRATVEAALRSALAGAAS